MKLQKKTKGLWMRVRTQVLTRNRSNKCLRFDIKRCDEFIQKVPLKLLSSFMTEGGIGVSALWNSTTTSSIKSLCTVSFSAKSRSSWSWMRLFWFAKDSASIFFSLSFRFFSLFSLSMLLTFKWTSNWDDWVEISFNFWNSSSGVNC